MLLDHLNELTVAPVLEAGAWAGFSIYPDTKMDEHRMVEILREYGTERILVNSAADWGRSDPLKTRRTAEAMLAAGFDDATSTGCCGGTRASFTARVAGWSSSR